MDGFNPANIDALLSQPQQNVVDAQNQNTINSIVQGGTPSIPQYQPPAPVKGSPLKQALGRFLYGASQAGLAATGQPTDYERQNQAYVNQLRAAQAQEAQTQNQVQQFNLQRQKAIIQQLQNMGQGGGDPFSQLGEMSPDEQALASTSKQQAMMAGSFAPIQDAIKQIVQQRAIFSRGALQGNYSQVTVTPEMVQSGVPRELLGQSVPSKLIQPYLNRAVFGQQPVSGAQGPALVNRNPMSPGFGQVTSLGLGNPGVAVAGARAQYTPVVVPDGQGGFTTISEAQALQSGAPLVGRPNATQIMGKQALIDDIKGGIEQLKQSSAILDNPGSKVKIAAALASPGLTTQTFLQSPILDSMSPAEQDYAIKLLSLREQAMAMRSVLGAGQGSEDLRRAITATIPTAATPNSAYANRQLDQFSTTLDRLAKGVPKLNNQGGAPKSPSGRRIIDLTK